MLIVLRLFLLAGLLSLLSGCQKSDQEEKYYDTYYRPKGVVTPKQSVASTHN